VNKVTAHGGRDQRFWGFDRRRMVFISSGYAISSGASAGNVILAFGPTKEGVERRMNRRTLLKTAGWLTLGYPIGRLAAVQSAPRFSSDPFAAGVASGDPLETVWSCGLG